MTVTACAEQVSVATAPQPSRHRPDRRSRPRSSNWNVLAEELVPFPPAPSRPKVAHELPGAAMPGRAAGAPTVRTGAVAGRAAQGRIVQRATRPTSRSRGLRRLLPGAATLAVLGCAWLGAGALAGLHDPALGRPPGAVKVAGGYEYTVRPGDTLWSIASELEPGGDPRPLVAQLESQLRGRELLAGERIRLP